MPKNLNLKAIRSLENTIRSHQSYIKELKTIHYRGTVTDDRIATIEKQIVDCENAILELRGIKTNA